MLKKILSIHILNNIERNVEVIYSPVTDKANCTSSICF